MALWITGCSETHGIVAREPEASDIQAVETLIKRSPCIASGRWVRYYGYTSERYLGGLFRLRMYDYTRLDVYYEQTSRHDNGDGPHFTKAGIYAYAVPPMWMTDLGNDDRYIRRAEGTYIPSEKLLKIECMPKFDSIEPTHETYKASSP